jgi:phage gpG-like protein
MSIEFEFDASAFISEIEGTKSNVVAGLKAAAIYFLSESAKTIRSGGLDWPAFRRPPKRPHQLLYDTGRLIGSLAPGGAMNVFESENDGLTLTVGSNLAYARAQNQGYAPHSLPARPFMFFDEQRTDAMARIIEKYVNGV